MKKLLAKKILISAAVCSTALFASCNHSDIKFDPEFYVPSIIDESIIYCEDIDDRGECTGATDQISYYDIKIESFACMSEDKVNELIEILIRARLPKKLKYKLIDTLKNNKQN